MPEPEPTETELRERQGALLQLFDRMLPIVDGIADSFRFATLLGIALVAWVFSWVFYCADFKLVTFPVTLAVIFLPVLLLAGFRLVVLTPL